MGEFEDGPLFTVDFGNGVIFAPRSHEEFDEWIEQERQFWDWLNGIQMKGSYGKYLSVLRNAINTFWGEIRELRSKLETGSSHHHQSVCDSIAREFRNHFCPGQNHILHASATPLAQRIKQLADADEQLEAAAMMVVSVRFQDPSLSYFLAAGVRLFSFNQGFSENVVAEKSSLVKLREEWSRELENWKSEYERQRIQNDDLADNESAAIKRFIDETEKVTKNHEEDMERIRAEFRDEMAVKCAVDYWSAKEKEHQDSANYWAKLSIGTFVFAVVILLSFFPTAHVKGATDGNARISELAAIGRYMLIVAFLVWPLRILVKNYMSNVHLQTDAAERKIVIMTYLALLLEPELKSQEGLKMQILPYALERIFRHSQTGIVKDEDGAPTGLHEILSGISKSK